MADNILRNDVEVTFKTFLEGVYAGRSKPFLEAAFRIGYGIFRGGSTLLSSIVRAVHPDNHDPDRDKDNFREVCLRANVLLGHVRTVLDMKTVRYITGRPRGRRRRDASPPTYFQTTLRLAF